MAATSRNVAALGATIALGIGGLATSSALAQEEGGYVYNRGEDRFVDNVYNFLKHFSYEQYYWCEAFCFTTSNNSYIDAMDFAYYSGHGNWWYLGMGPGASGPSGVNTRTAGSWGDWDLEFIVFQSCSVVPTVPEEPDLLRIHGETWYSPWVPHEVFQGLHQAIGYRTNSYSGNGISNNFGERIARGEAVWQSWFNAVNDERSWWRGSDYPGYASCMLYPGLDNDVYPSYAADPPDNHGSLRTYWQH